MRRGKKIITEKSNITVDTNHNNTENNDNNSTFVIPTLNIFSKFQNKRDDFEKDWAMLEETENENENKKILGDALLEKLKQQQLSMSTVRGGKDKNNNENENNNNNEEYAPGEVDEEQYNNNNNNKNNNEKLESGFSEEYVNLMKKDQMIKGTQNNVLKDATLAKSDLYSSVQNNNHNNKNKNYKKENDAIAVPLWSADTYEKKGGYYILENNHNNPNFNINQSLHPLYALHAEITDLLQFLKPKKEEIILRHYIQHQFSLLVKKLFPEGELILYGSSFTNLWLSTSDMDFTIVKLKKERNREDVLTTLAREINVSHSDLNYREETIQNNNENNKNENSISPCLCEDVHPQLILKTKVPLIKLKHRHSLLQLDISVGAVDGFRNSLLTKILLEEYPEARGIIILIKYFLAQRGMHEPYTGGLGSFGVTLLAISFLQQYPFFNQNNNNNNNNFNHCGYGKLLIDFFRYYGLYWNYEEIGLTVADIFENNNNNKNESLMTALTEDEAWDSYVYYGEHKKEIHEKVKNFVESISKNENKNNNIQNIFLEKKFEADKYLTTLYYLLFSKTHPNKNNIRGKCFQKTDDIHFNASSPTTTNNNNNNQNQNFPPRPCQAYLEDPGAKEHNVLSSLRNYKAISSVFTYAYQALTSDLSDFYTKNFQNKSEIKDLLEQYVSPDAAEVAFRPTLLSRVFHVDSELILTRKRILKTVELLKEKEPHHMRIAENFYDFHHLLNEDAIMLSGNYKNSLFSSWHLFYKYNVEQHLSTVEEKLKIEHNKNKMKKMTLNDFEPLKRERESSRSESPVKRPRK